MGLARQSLHLDQGNRIRRLSDRLSARAAWVSQREEFDLAVDHADRLRRFFSDHRWAANLGPRASGTFSFDLYEATMAQLAGEGGFHNRGLHNRACTSFHGELGWIDVVSIVADDRRDSLVGFDGDLHRVSLRASEGTRHVAEPAVATAPLFSGTAFGSGGSVAAGSGACRCVRRRSLLAIVDARIIERNSLADGLGRSLSDASDGTRAARHLGDGEGEIQKRFLDWNDSVAAWWVVAAVVRTRRFQCLDRSSRRTVGVDGLDALRKRLRPSRPVRTTCLNLERLRTAC